MGWLRLSQGTRMVVRAQVRQIGKRSGPGMDVVGGDPEPGGWGHRKGGLWQQEGKGRGGWGGETGAQERGGGSLVRERVRD